MTWLKSDTQQDKTAAKFPDLLARDFTAAELKGRRRHRDSTTSGKSYLATVIDLYSRRLLASATSFPDAELACEAI